MYAYIDGQYVYNVYDKIEQYSEDFKRHCIKIPEGLTVLPGYLYSSENKEFTAPRSRITMPIFEEDIRAVKSEKIAESKTKLAEWLENNPMLYSDGKYYSVTAEKQSLLNSNLASYERAEKAGIYYPLKWNSTGDECTKWEYADLLKLSLTIAAYVAPKVSMQQTIELAIDACSSIDEINAMVIDYDNHTEEN